jgi:mRNA-degrading endonuclease YafQ of YafQ-DinJ toxin-antitoxin module
VASSKRTLRVELTPELKAAIRRLSKKQRRQIGQVITAVRDGFGAPHLHSGLGLRRLRDSLFECRVGLKLRLVFDAEPGVLSFSDIGTHDQIRKLLRKR